MDEWSAADFLGEYGPPARWCEHEPGEMVQFGVCGAMEQKSGLGKSGKKSKRCMVSGSHSSALPSHATIPEIRRAFTNLIVTMIH